MTANRHCIPILALYAASVIPVVLKINTLLATILTAPLLYLLPCGLGMLLLYGIPGRFFQSLSAILSILIAYFTGLFAFILCFIVSERSFGEGGYPLVLFGILWFASAAGWLRIRQSLRFEWDEKLFAPLLMTLLALSIFRYAYSLLIYSDYPVTDLFQRVQFHGGAWNFAHNLTLNPFVAGSYIPFQQLQLGLLLRLTGADPLIAEWVWPLAAMPLQAMVIYAFTSAVLPTRSAASIALLIILAQTGLSNPTNGTIAELSVITMLAIILSDGSDTGAKYRHYRWKAAALLTGCLAGLLMTKSPIEVAVVIFLAVSTVTFALGSRGYGTLAGIIITAAMTVTFHRSALLFIAIGGTLSFAYPWLCQRHASGSMLVRKCASALFIALSLMIVAAGSYIVTRDKQAHDIFGLWQFFDIILMPVAGKSLAVVAIDGDLAPGAGSRVALFELVRTLSPLVVFGLSAFVVGIARNRVRRLATDRDERAGIILGQMTACLIIVALILTGFPFIHRSSFLAVLFASTALAHALDGEMDSRCRLWALSAIGYAFFLSIVVYLLGPENVQPYLLRLLPWLCAALVAGCLLSIAIARYRLNWLSIGALIAVAVSAETAISKTYFKSYSFQKQPLPKTAALSSFDMEDLALGDELRAQMDGSELVFSDPKTMTFLWSRTGLMPIVSTSNLDTVDQSPAQLIRRMLGELIGTGNRVDLCKALASYMDENASGLYNYARYRDRSPYLRGKDVLASLKYRNRLVPSFDGSLPDKVFAEDVQAKLDDSTRQGQSYLVAINETTLKWLDNPAKLNYFPLHGALPVDVMANLKRNLPEGQIRSNTYWAKIRCQPNPH